MTDLAQRLSVEIGLSGELRRKDEWATVVFATWMITGLFLDGWAHRVEKPETFFSPWHTVLYSGFAAGMLYAGIETARQRSGGERTGMERLMVAGFVLFGVAGIGDMLWHQAFGIEEGIEALLSPTHLMLMGAGLLLATGPVRSAWKDSEDRTRTSSLRSFVPTLVGFAGATALVGFFTMYLSVFTTEGVATVSSMPDQDDVVALGIASILLTNALLLVPMFVVLRRWHPPMFSFTALFGLVAIAMTGLDAFHNYEVALPAVLAGLVADSLVRRGGRAHAIRFGGWLVPVVLWGAWFAVCAVRFEVAWTPELWTGAIALSALSGKGLSLLVAPQADRSRLAVS